MADETGFWLYLVEHAPGGLSAAQLAVVHRALGEAVGREIRPGSRIRYVQRIDVPGEHRCLWLFEAAGPEAVRAVNDLAQFPLTRVITVLSAAPGETSPIADLEQAGPDRQNAPPAAPEETDENVARRLAEIPAGSWTKWPVVGCWVAVVAAAYPLTGKLNGAEKNDTSAWLPRQCRVGQGPGCADPPPATQHLPRGGRVLPGLRADRGGPGQGGRRRPPVRRAARGAARPGGGADPVGGWHGDADDRAGQRRHQGLQRRERPGRLHARDRPGRGERPGLSHHRPAGVRGRQRQGVHGLTSTLLYAALAVVIVILLISYRIPVLWILPVISSVAALITAEAVDCLLAAHAGLTVNQESAAILAVLVFGVSTDYVLLLVARYREELRRHNRRLSTWDLLTGPSAIELAISLMPAGPQPRDINDVRNAWRPA